MDLRIFSLLVCSVTAFSVINEQANNNDARIVGGSDVTPGEYNYMVSVQDGSDYYYRHICGGTIYNSEYVITSGRCMERQNISFPSYMRVVAGEHTLYSIEGNEQFINVTSVTVHEDYSEFSHSNDIALLKLVSPLNFSSSFAGPILMPDSEEDSNGFCTALGWGLTTEDGISSNILRDVYLQVVDDPACRDIYGDGNIEDSMMCAGGTGLGVCDGDWGGPLVCQKAEGFYFGGIISWGYGCGKEGYTSVFAQVSYYLNWITDNAV